ncbi:sugar isomerase [Aquimarina sp. ERC-38]|uniref:sugar isomerase n=1 Tax=Aquimarina sp. ERC-38 TaxID=2949996 RepID=UPI002246C725|nr:sugar isomerase [Aquimarina sp. ERC-38]UZO82258.1 sugar isomerase [Aquimarina sp. ERC-38]
MTTLKSYLSKVSGEQKFLISGVIVNAGNYFYNLAMGRILGPTLFADAALFITFLLILSFMAMTFQLTTAKFTVSLTSAKLKAFIKSMYGIALLFGVLTGLCLIGFANVLQQLFRTQSSILFVVFGIGVPFYFMMSVNRGILQGNQSFEKLGLSYQSEMFSRLLITLALVYFCSFISSSLLVVIGIIASFIFGMFPFKKVSFSSSDKALFPKGTVNKTMLTFFIITAFYEMTLIIINNSDIILVKHYFEEYQAGLYASLALIGRLVYFVSWMFIMLLLPTVIKLKKENKATTPILFKYIGYIFILAGSIVLACYLFPETLVSLAFGSDYLSIAPLLYKYAIATSLFAVANLFAYYYLSLDHYVPIIFSGFAGIAQVGLVIIWHQSLAQVVEVQILVMTVLLLIQLGYFLVNNRRQV